jgi:hypothetical protein
MTIFRVTNMWTLEKTGKIFVFFVVFALIIVLMVVLFGSIGTNGGFVEPGVSDDIGSFVDLIAIPAIFFEILAISIILLGLMWFGISKTRSGWLG